MAKILKDHQLRQLRDWLDKFPCSKMVAINKLHRDFSDGVAVANILKELFPKLIDLHNYSPSSSVKLKRSNWETLNHKAFKKLGMHQSSRVLDSISKSTPGYIEQLLYNVMCYENSARKKSMDTLDQNEESQFAINDEVLMVNLNKQIGDAMVQVPQKMILYSIYEQTLKESKEKDNQISALSQKVIHLENIIGLKSERIEELSGQLTKLSVRNFLKNEAMSNCCSNSAICYAKI